ncbi:hypothetical protein [Nakamurella alba]|uniref:hypothetical protein n=1 Tax=Nakamurella alba TaxID=2665158 RepID=UPI0018AC1B37|nr:hypothetical protein [Nakamurella alba]
MSDGPMAHLVGRRVPGGTYRMEPYESRLAREALHAVADDEPHPVMAFIGVQRGMGCSVRELFELLEFDIDDGPLLARTTISVPAALHTDTPYAVAGAVTDVRRKSGRALGDFDLVTCEFTMDDATGRAATVTNVYALRRSA